MTTRKLTMAAAAALCAVAIGACGDDDESGSQSASSGGVEITDAWSRVTAPSAKAGAVYMTISAQDGDTLTKAAVPTSIAGTTEIHETSAAHGSMGDDAVGDDKMGAMTMKPVSSIEIPAGEDVQLEPGGYHVMLLELADPITDGETIPVTLTFEQAGEVEVEATARTS